MIDERQRVSTNETLFLGIDAGFMLVLIFNFFKFSTVKSICTHSSHLCMCIHLWEDSTQDCIHTWTSLQRQAYRCDHIHEIQHNHHNLQKIPRNKYQTDTIPTMTEILTIINKSGLSLQDHADKIKYFTMLCLTITGSLIWVQMPSSRTVTEKNLHRSGVCSHENIPS